MQRRRNAWQALKARQDEEFNRQWPRLEAAVIEHARESQLDLVVQAPVLYASARIDITDAVLARLKREAALEPAR
ncbi:MAG: OmpH family outer membrane protein [Xanthomonadales bacterium]|nr:OmpH family outer membrane protein [Xanthomonadales bacterium]